MAEYLGIDITATIQNDIHSNKESSQKLVPATPSSIINNPVKTKKNTLKTENVAIPVHTVKRCGRTGSLNESLNTSVSGTCASRIDKRNVKGETQLHVACLKQDVQRIRELLELGANPNTQDNAGWTPLHEVVSCGNEEIVALLVENGANPNIPGGQNETSLHDAVACNRTNIVRLLVSHGADVNARNSRGLTPKDLCSKDNEDITAALQTSMIIPATPSNPDRTNVRTTLQTICLFVLNMGKKSYPGLSKLARNLNFKIATTYSSSVTHLAVRLDDPINAIKANAHFYSAVLLGQFIVDFKWIEESAKLERLTDVCQYEIDGTLNKAPAGGALSRLNVANQLPGLFNNCFFYLNGLFSTPSKADITQWIKHGGGTLLTRSPNPESISPCKKIPYHASPTSPLAQCSHFILYDSRAKTQPTLKYNMSHVKSLSVDWLVASIENFSLVDPFGF
ncbi:BRCA1-associated RING domain protein 1-like isoform X2 [Daphnia carinata]|nr:BRCA1-associated RING domain protein 1-like isoform X2 [Daphnia carinata]